MVLLDLICISFLGVCSLTKKPAPGRGQHRMKGTAPMLCWQSQLLGLWAEKSGRVFFFYIFCVRVTVEGEVSYGLLIDEITGG